MCSGRWPGVARARDAGVADVQRAFVAYRLVLVVHVCVLRDVEDRAGCLREAAAAREVVGVVVGLEHVPDAEVVLVGEDEVILDLPFRIDHRPFAAVGDHVGSAGQVFVQHLPEEDAQRSPPRSWCARKNSAEPAVAIAAEAEISSASVAAATIWAKR